MNSTQACLKKQIDSLTTSALSGFGSSSVYLSNLGVRTERSGLLSLNTTVLENTLENNPSSLDAVFNSMYSSGSSLLSVSGGSNSNPTAGTYAYAMTAYVSGAFTGLVSSDTTPGVTSSNNTIKLIIIVIIYNKKYNIFLYYIAHHYILIYNISSSRHHQTKTSL